MVAEGNLPVRLSSFVGRDSELAELVELVGTHRLVTLTGPGGGGKTRLAITLADRMRPRYAGVRWLGLATTGAADGGNAVLAALADVLELPEATVEAVTGRLSSGPSLLVVDNCEHLLRSGRAADR